MTVCSCKSAVKMEPIRILGTDDYPYSADCFDLHPSKKCSHPGLEIEYIYTVVAKMMGRDVEWVKVDDYDIMDAYLEEGKADIMGVSYVLDPESYPDWQYSPIYLYDGVALIVKETVKDGASGTLLTVFNWNLWLGLLLFSIGIQIFSAVSNSLSGGPTAVWRRRRIIQVFWILALSIILEVFTNLMAISLVQPSTIRTVPFETIPELGSKLLDKTCRFVLPETHKDGEEFMNTIINATHKRPWANSFRQAYVTNPPLWKADRDEVMDYILFEAEPGECFVTMDYTTMETYYMSRYCNIRYMHFPDDLSSYGYVFYYTNKSLFSPQIETVMSSDSMIGFVHFLERKYYSIPFPPKCISYGVEVAPLPLYKIKDSFWVLFSGIAFTVCLLGIELLTSWITKRQNQSRVMTLSKTKHHEPEVVHFLNKWFNFIYSIGRGRGRGLRVMY